ncbi:hypothetical protein N9B73_01305 [Verrucomicrobiales bacterium]|nr:hypothetical protein [Verrucomicrobiales bacterium]
MTRILFAALGMSLMLSSCETTDSIPDIVNAPAEIPGAVGEVDAATPAASGPKPYPRKDCLVTGEKLDSKNTPMTFVHKGQEIKVCCSACKMAFNMSPRTYLAKIQ